MGTAVLGMRRSRVILAAVAGLVALVVGVSPAQAGTVSVFPIPGGRLATPQTQITFRGVPAAELGPILVHGSVSGVHLGQVRADSDGRGGSFLPAKPFTPGETVTVTTTQNVINGRSGTFSFTVAHGASAGGGGHAFTPLPRVRGDVYHFVSRPDLVPAAISISKFPSHTQPGGIFVASQSGPVQSGPEIFGPWGGLVFAQPVPRGESATDFRAQTYRGQSVLTWWQGSVSLGGTGIGKDEIYDRSYRHVATVTAANGLSADLHEFQLTPQNTALITAYHPVHWNTTSLRHGPNQRVVLDSVVQEIDIPTGLVLFQWDSLDHVTLGDSHQPLPSSASRPWDYFHVNSIQRLSDGSLLVSGRNTWSLLDISHQTARTQWTLGGRHSSFKTSSRAHFAFQHDGRLRGGNELTVFDDGAGPPAVEKQSRGLTLLLNFTTHRATLVRQDMQRGLLAFFEGNVQLQPNGDDFVGWGQQPVFSEFNSRGQEIFSGHFVGHTNSYRAYRFPWSAQPAAPPDTALRVHGGRRTVYVSWNGATVVSRWRIAGGRTPASRTPIASRARRTFETAIRLPHAFHYVVAEALDSHGHVLATSAPMKG